MSITVPLYGFGTGGSGGTLTVVAPAGVTVSVGKDGKVKTTTANAEGLAAFKGLTTGTWTLTITDSVQAAAKSVEIITDYNAVISFNAIPDFTYTGDFEIVNDSDEQITASKSNWKIRFLTSGTLTFNNLNGAEDGIDVFLVGGGGSGGARSSSNSNYAGGGGGGYTKTVKKITVTKNTAYEIVIGAGGIGVASVPGNNGGETSAFGQSVSGGTGTGKGKETGIYDHAGGDGGSGGGGRNKNQNGGTDGNDGEGSDPGVGQGITTREFEQPEGKLYSSGGDGGIDPSGVTSGTPNTGDGGDGGTGGTGGNGGSGIVIIRNARG